MQVELIALREEESGGDKRGGGTGFMHRQELELAASSGTSCVIQGVFWAAKLHLQDGNRRNYRLQGKESRVRVYFSQDFFDFSSLPHCLAVCPWCLSAVESRRCFPEDCIE